jgi:hypothetical protein
MSRIALICSIGLLFVVVAAVSFGGEAYEAEGQADSNLCPSVINAALTRMDAVCEGTGRNQICYGHTYVAARPQEDVLNFDFGVGDMTPIENIAHLRMSPLNMRLQEWGLALMRVQANLPDVLPGQNVTFLLFGDVQITPEARAEYGETERYGEAFRLQTGVGGIECTDAPPDGVLIQTPQGTRRVELRINGIDIRLGSTIFIQAIPGEYFTVRTLEGVAVVEVDGVVSVAVAGTEVSVPINDDLLPVGDPEMPEAYTPEPLQLLPIQSLDSLIEIADPLPVGELVEVIDQIAGGNIEELIDLYDSLTGEILWFDGEWDGVLPLEGDLGQVVTTLGDTALILEGVVGDEGIGAVIATPIPAVVEVVGDVVEDVGGAVATEVPAVVNTVVGVVATQIPAVVNTLVDDILPTSLPCILLCG